MIPLKDNLRYSKFAWVSVTIFALNVLMYIGQMTLDTSGTLQTTISSWLPVRDVLTTAIAEGDPWLIGRSIAAVFLGSATCGSSSASRLRSKREWVTADSPFSTWYQG
jgi:hypothetical protein